MPPRHLHLPRSNFASVGSSLLHPVARSWFSGCKSIVAGVKLIRGHRLFLASNLSMASFATVLALNATIYYTASVTFLCNSKWQFHQMLTVARFRASSTFMAILVAVSALHLGHVFGLRAFVSSVTFLVAVTTHHLLGLRTVTSRVTLLTAVETSA